MLWMPMADEPALIQIFHRSCAHETREVTSTMPLITKAESCSTESR
jgi:hypothetical protein